ncbi:MAG: TonB-dependent receptor [Gemmatimonadota bacterium]|nr:MAG: TonB-dependent receptor [Gemmatimonadota bacterium]
MRLSSVVVGILLLAGLTHPVEGQVVRGRLLDLHTNQPIAEGVLTLIPEQGRGVLSVVTGDDGAYRLEAPAPGRYFIEARRFGYRSWVDGPIDLRAGDDWETEYHLAAIPFVLDPVVVTVPRTVYEAFLERVGFFERQKGDFGHFITRDEIERRVPARMTDLLSTIPGVRLVPSSSGLSRSSLSFRGSVLSMGGACHPRVFVDGLIVILGDARVRGTDVYGFPELGTEVAADPSERPEIALDDVVMPGDVEAVEVYRRASEVPAQFGGMSTATQCGVIAIWTRRGWRRNP